jgi:hypothetical protein
MSQDGIKGDNVTPGSDNVAKGDQNEIDLDAKGSDQYSKEYVARLKDSYFKEREKRKEVEAKLANEAKVKLEQDNKFKELYELEKQEKEKYANDVKTFHEKERKSLMLSAVSKKLLDLGLDPVKQSRALRLLDLNGLIYDEATNTVLGADRVAQKFYEENNDLGFFKNKVANVDQRSGVVGKVEKDTTKMTKNELLRAATQASKW